MCQFLRDAVMVAASNFQLIANQVYSPECRAMVAKPDFLLPLRSWGQSCRRVNGHQGTGIRPNFARTNAGLFSLLVFRGISFNTAAFHSQSDTDLVVEFDSLSKCTEYFNRLLDTFRSNELCNKRAYSSQPIVERAYDNYTQFWHIASVLGWEQLFTDDDSVGTFEVLPFGTTFQ